MGDTLSVDKRSSVRRNINIYVATGSYNGRVYVVLAIMKHARVSVSFDVDDKIFGILPELPVFIAANVLYLSL